MFCKYLTLHIITISVLNCLFLLCGAEVDAKLNDAYEDDHDIIRNATKEQYNSSDSDTPSYSPRRRPLTTSETVIYVVIAVVVAIIIISIKFCCKYMRDTSEDHDVGDAIVHPPPPQGPTVPAPTRTTGPFQQQNRDSAVLPPNDAFPIFVSVYNPNYGRAPYNAESSTVHADADHANFNPSLDLPPSYESVVNSDKSRNTAHQFPTVPEQTPTAPDQEKY